MDKPTHLRNTTLHDQEIRIVDIELDTLEQCLDSVLCGLVAIEKVF